MLLEQLTIQAIRFGAVSIEHCTQWATLQFDLIEANRAFIDWVDSIDELETCQVGGRDTNYIQVWPVW